MAKKKKNDNATSAAEPQNGATASNATPPARTRTAAKASSTKTKKTTRKAPAAKRTKAAGKSAPAREPSDDEIRMRAYFIAERRHRFALPGDADSDWLEAKRQLLVEIQPR